MLHLIFAAIMITAVDGDTLRRGSERIRLVGIDAPELSQTCHRGGVMTLCGRDARDALQHMVAGGVTCKGEGLDRYGRTLAVCFDHTGTDIGEQMVLQGHAVAYRHAPRYLREQAIAKVLRRGMHAGTFIDPADWRKGKRW